MTSTLLGKMSKDLFFSKERLDYLIRSAPYRYKVYEVPKKSGTGKRTIAQPAKEVKKLQYWVINNIFPRFAVHPSATAYTKEKNIFNNCEPHVKNPYLLKLDFQDFFPSIKGKDFLYYAKSQNQLDLREEDLLRLTRILFWAPKGEDILRLSIGAPSSPFLSNAMMFNFDCDVYKFCSERGVVYTRYADDMSFSMQDPRLRGNILDMVIDVLSKLPSPELKINFKKTVFGSKAHRRMITGLILSNDGNVSFGRTKKRIISAQVHHFMHGRLNEPQKERLRGMLSFIKSIEPDYIKRLERKYGEKIISDIKNRKN